MTIAISCQTIKRHQSNVVTQDIDNFWESYELAKKESDSLLQIQLIDSLYIQKGSIGLKKMMEVRNYTASEYVNLINNYPNFFESIVAITFWLPPRKTSPIPQNTKGKMMIPTRSFTKNDLDNFPIEVVILLI